MKLPMSADMEHQVISKKDAKALGLTRYFTGKPCPKGHISERMVSNGDCKGCMAARKTTPQYKAQAVVTMTRWYETNRGRVLAKSVEDRRSNPLKYQIKDREQYQKHKEANNRRSREYKRQNPHVRRENQAARRARIRQTTVAEERQAITEFYKNCPSGYEVDHIIPLAKGGAHTITNLQYLTKEENRRKRAKLPSEFIIAQNAQACLSEAR